MEKTIRFLYDFNESEGPIKGVHLLHLKRNEDERGYLTEIYRKDAPGFQGFAQVYVSQNAPGVIRAWHYHKKQTDCWTVVKGKILVGLYDERKDSPSYGNYSEYILSEHSNKALVIPCGVWHGYKTIDKSLLLNMTDQLYDPKDEFREVIDAFQFDWKRNLNG
jgi:dTDP-4-dehydrorhamnose 3,5-epimerase